MVKQRPQRGPRWTRALLRHAVVAPAAVLVASGAVIAVTPALMSGPAVVPPAAETEDASAATTTPAVALPAQAPDTVEAASSTVGWFDDYRQPAAQIPPAALAAYQRSASVMAAAAPTCHLDWSVLAAIGRIASNHGGGEPQFIRPASTTRRVVVAAPIDRFPDTDAGRLDGDPEHDVGVGPLLILPTTWAVVAVDSDDDGTRDPEDLDDAALAAAVVLCGDGRNLSDPVDFREAAHMFNTAHRYPVLLARLARWYESDLSYRGGSTTLVVDQLPPAPSSTVPATTSAPPTPSSTPSPADVASASSDATRIDIDPEDPDDSTAPVDPTTSATPTPTKTPTPTPTETPTDCVDPTDDPTTPAEPSDDPAPTDPVPAAPTTGSSTTAAEPTATAAPDEPDCDER
jgi:membrane-bound lytic murein transglycosylase B